jgi:hypothetical protein
MTRRSLLWVPLAACLRADSGDEIRQLLNSAAEALRNHDEKKFLATFDPSMKGYRELASNVRGLLRDADVIASIEITSERMNWTLSIAAHDLSAGETRRQASARYVLENSGGKLRIASFEPVTLFAPPHGREAWDAISGVARDLQVASQYADVRRQNPASGPTGLQNLLDRFDHAMPGYAQFETNLRALTSIWLLEPALQLTSNEGDDTHRSLEIDWTMTLTDPLNSGKSLRKQETMKCRIEKRGKQWIVVSLAPLEFFAPPQL